MLCHLRRVEDRAVRTLERMRPAIKRRWAKLLRARPVPSPLAHPDVLVYLMDQTLDQLCSALRTRSFRSWLKRNPVVIAPLQSRCTCHLNPLLTYYCLGEQALRETGELALGNGMSEVALFYHGLAQRELDALCGACCHRDAPGCQTTQPETAAADAGIGRGGFVVTDTVNGASSANGVASSGG